MRTPLPSWTYEYLYFVTDDYFRALIIAINEARESVSFEAYIYEKGILANRITEALKAAAQRGVHVRLLVDGIGSPFFVSDFESTLRTGGVEIHYYRTLPWTFRELPGEPKFLLNKLFYRLLRLNKGNHRKLCLIDKKSLWVGSANISDVHLQEINGANAWKDLGVCVEGVDIPLAVRAFDSAFKRGHSLRLQVRRPRLLAIGQTYFQKRHRRAAQWRRLKMAEKRIWIQTPYFVPLARVVRRMIRKAKQGVDVRILVPAVSDVWIMKWISFYYLRILSENGVKVFQSQRTFVHQKIYLIDDWICIGSTNLNHRSFLHDLEIDVVITHPNNKTQLETNFLLDQDSSVPFVLDQWRDIATWKKCFCWFLGLFSYWS
jgi:cardiolipin synthase